LSRSVAARRARARAEFPTTVDMVCLAVTAGESLRGALELVAGTGGGPLASEIRVALRVARGGVPLADALQQRARGLGLPPYDRFLEAVIAAQERGLPLGEALRAMAFDVREAEKRKVIEAAGRKQVSMLVPVIGLILPVAIVFAFFPGVIAIRTLAR
jgi:tight adherence protein C